MNYVLIVDDEPLIRASVSKKVEEFCTSVAVSETTCNGQEALEWMENHYADICITDVRMPVMDGLELIRNINEKYPWMVCLIISSYDDFNYARQGIKLGVVDYILKPISQALLNEGLEKAREKVYTSRLDQAHDILLKKSAYHRRMQEKWVGFIKKGKLDSMQVIIKDTLKLLKDYAEGKSYLLEAFSIAWLQVVDGELKKESISIERKEEYSLQTGRRELAMDEAEGYFEGCARQRLENGLSEMYDFAKIASVKKETGVWSRLKSTSRPITQNPSRCRSLPIRLR